MKGYWDCDFYQVEERDSKKVVHIMGWFWSSDQGEEKNCRLTECTFFIVPLDEFITWTNDQYCEAEEKIKQYVSDLTEEEAIDTMRHFYNGNPPIPLRYKELTMETPCGGYVNAAEVIE